MVDAQATEGDIVTVDAGELLRQSVLLDLRVAPQYVQGEVA